MGDRGAGGNDLLSFDQDLSGGKHAAALDIEQAGRMEHDGVRGCGSLRQRAWPEGHSGREPKRQGCTSAADLIRFILGGQDGLQDIRSAIPGAPERITMIATMRLRRKIREVTYHFEDLRDLLAKASPYRSGDALAGIAAESGEQRAAAQMTLADLPLQAFLQQALVPYEDDEVTRLIIDTHDAAAFAPIAMLTVGDFRDWLLSDDVTGEVLAAVTPGLRSEERRVGKECR